MASPTSFTKSFESRGESRRSTLRKSHPLAVHHCTNGTDAEACAISRLVVSRRGVASRGNEKWIDPYFENRQRRFRRFGPPIDVTADVGVERFIAVRI